MFRGTLKKILQYHFKMCTLNIIVSKSDRRF
jgi:hypothetical protein